MNFAYQNSFLKLIKNIMIRFSDFLTKKLTTLPVNNFLIVIFRKNTKKFQAYKKLKNNGNLILLNGS